MTEHPSGASRSFEPPSSTGESNHYPPSWDRIYPRCPVCRTEQYGPAVLGFSQGDHGCWCCDHVIREDARLKVEEELS